jgi:D-proline reductase (dithiol) PrdB
MLLRRRKNQWLARLVTRFPALGRLWAGTGTSRDAEGIPWSPLHKPLIDCTVALITTAGVHLRDQVPFDMQDPEGDPTFREIPRGACRSDLMITHDYYDHRDADRDIDIVFPIHRLGELRAQGIIGKNQGWLRGSVREKCAPWPGALATWMLPP